MPAWLMAMQESGRPDDCGDDAARTPTLLLCFYSTFTVACDENKTPAAMDGTDSEWDVWGGFGTKKYLEIVKPRELYASSSEKHGSPCSLKSSKSGNNLIPLIRSLTSRISPTTLRTFNRSVLHPTTTPSLYPHRYQISQTRAISCAC